MNASFVLVMKDGQRRAFELNVGVIVMGRRPECDLRIPLMDVSRRHCSLDIHGDSFVLRDLGSSNGTFVNGQRIEEVQLKSGDNIQIGPLTFIFENGDTATPPSTEESKNTQNVSGNAVQQISDEDFFANIGPLGDIKSSSATDLPNPP
jgi:pSer/pThr/pTyr-binding forkhead associated (FHA) protein